MVEKLSACHGLDALMVGLAFPLSGLLLGCVLIAEAAAAEASSTRIGVPALACPRDELTSYEGELAGYVPGPDGILLTIATDWQTQEQVRLPPQVSLPQPGAPLNSTQRENPYLGQRVRAWICLESATPPVVEWAPRRDGL